MMLDQTYYSEMLEHLSGDAQDKNTYAQANAKHILMSVDTDPADYPRFNPQLADQTDAQTYLYLEIGVNLYKTEREKAVVSFERGAQLIEYNHTDYINKVSTSNFNLLVGAIAYYCARQYSKSFILLKKVEEQTEYAKLIKAFLSKDFALLRKMLNEILLVDRNAVEQYDKCQLIIFAEALSLLLNYIETGNKELIARVDKDLSSLQRLAEIDNMPDLWWLFRMMRIVADTISENSLWECLEGLDINNALTSKYIRGLVFHPKHAVIELFPSQKAALEKVLSESGAVVCLPTSSGKTRIAEICILQAIINDSNAKILYIAPFRSLAFEIEESLAGIFRHLNISVTHLYGGAVYTKMDQELIEESQLLIATPEKAKAILRGNKSIFEAIKLVIMDEGHLIGLEDRYLANEMFTEELKRTTRNNGGKFVLLSAVLPNPEDIAKWIAESEDNYVTNSWRASSQRLGLMSYTGYSVNIDWLSEPPGFNRHFIDGTTSKYDAIAKTAVKLSKLGSVMVFIAKAKCVLSQGRAINDIVSEKVDWENSLEWQQFELACKESAADELLELGKKGILCHSNRLPSNVRKAMESLLRLGKAKYIIATATLAQGVNVGVSVVIFHSVDRSYNDFIPARDFWNIAGRAGRAFVDSEGIILYLLDQSVADWNYKNQKKRALEYFNASKMEQVSSGVGLLLREIYSVSKKSGIAFEKLIELLANDNLEDLLDVKEISRLNSLDDSLLSLVGEADESEIEERLKNMLAYIQEKKETSKTVMLRMLKARVRAVKAKSKGVNWEKATALGIPLDDAIYLQEHIEDFRQLAVDFTFSDETEEDLFHFVEQFESLINLMPSGKFIYDKLDNDDFKEVQKLWINGDSYTNEKNGQKYVNEYISFIVPWAMNAVSRELSIRGDEAEATVYLNMAARCESGLPNVSAIKIFKSGIQSRAASKNISAIEENSLEDESISAVANLIEEQKEILIENEKSEEITKEWVSFFYEKRNNPKDKMPVLPKLNFNVEFDKNLGIIYCSQKGDEFYFRSDDYSWKWQVEPTEELPFDKIADVPGVGFKYIGDNNWKMFNRNVWYSVK